VFDFEGAESTQLEAREIARNAGWHAPVISAGIDLLLIAARRHDPGAVETLLQETTAAAATTPGWHEWLWRLRLCQARAELALARDAFEVSVAEATEAIDQSRAKGRPKYESLGLATKARALHGLGRMRDAIIDARSAVDVARSTADPALLLQTLDVLLALDGSDELAAERARSQRSDCRSPARRDDAAAICCVGGGTAHSAPVAVARRVRPGGLVERSKGRREDVLRR